MSGINKLSFVYLRYERTVFVIAVIFTFLFALCQHHTASNTLQQHGEWPLGPLYKNLVPWSHSLDGHDSMDIPPAKAELSPCQLSLLMTQSTVSASVLLFYKTVLAKFQPFSFAIFFWQVCSWNLEKLDNKVYKIMNKIQIPITITCFWAKRLQQHQQDAHDEKNQFRRMANV